MDKDKSSVSTVQKLSLIPFSVVVSVLECLNQHFIPLLSQVALIVSELVSVMTFSFMFCFCFFPQLVFNDSNGNSGSLHRGCCALQVVLVVAFFSLARIRGEGSTIHFPPMLFFFFFLSADQLMPTSSTF